MDHALGITIIIGLLAMIFYWSKMPYKKQIVTVFIWWSVLSAISIGIATLWDFIKSMVPTG